MPVTTFTASDVVTIKAQHAGPTVVRTRIVITPTTNSLGTLTASSVVYLAKIPAGAILLDGYLSGGTSSGGEGTWNLGIRDGTGSTTFKVNPISGVSVSDNALIAGGTLSAGGLLRFSSGATGALPYQVSCSDGEANQFHWLVATAILGSGTATVSLNLVCQYLANTNS
jgi:hypothetical protein